MTHSIIGRFSDHDSVAQCVNHLLEIGIKKDQISLMTNHDSRNNMTANSVGFFQKNGDISSEAGGAVVGGILGSAIGSLMGIATFVIPPVGFAVGAGPLVAALCGGVIGGTIGEGIAESMDATVAPNSPLHPYIAALKEGDILCGVETESNDESKINEVMLQYAASVAPWQGGESLEVHV